MCLSDEEKAGARTTFFSKVKEELAFIPAQLKVIEYWQEKAVFDRDGEEFIVAARRPVHPLGKCFATTALLAYIIVAKYADGLPLYRLENMLARSGHPVGRTNMAHWIIRLAKVFAPLLARLRDVQNSGRYLQMDESRIQVLKEEGKTAQSDKWMWVIRGGLPINPQCCSSMTRAARVVFPCACWRDSPVFCKPMVMPVMTRCAVKTISCVSAAGIMPGANILKRAKRSPRAQNLPKANPLKRMWRWATSVNCMALNGASQGRSEADKYLARQQYSLPLLNAFKLWLEQNVGKIMKGSLTRQAMDYTLNHWAELIGYCDHGQVNISNALAENAIRPFAVGRKAWLFADSSQGASASAGCYSLIETAKANQLEPTAYIQYVLDHIGEADTQEKLDALLPWNVDLVPFLKNVSQYG